jgi:AAA family ATP:ADP antiporter
MVAFVCIKTGRDAVFFNQGGLLRLPVAYLWIALASLPAGMLHFAAIRSWGARCARVRVMLLAAVLFVLFVPWVGLEHQRGMLVLFSMTPVVFAAVFASAWLLAGDLLEGASTAATRWAYSRIGAGSMVGGILGGLLARQLAPVLSPRYLVLLGALFLLVAAGVARLAHRRKPLFCRRTDEDRQMKAGAGGTRPRETSSLIREPYVLGLIGVGSLSAVAALFIDFQFYAVVSFAGRTSAEFFGGFYAAIHVASLALQLTVSPWLQGRYGVGRTLMVLPVAILGGVGWAALSATVLSRSVLKLAESGVKASIHRSVWEQVFLPLEHGSREMVKMFVDGLSARLAEGFGAAFLYLWVRNMSSPGQAMDLSSLFWLILLAVSGWLGLTVYLNRRGCREIEASEVALRLPDS